MEESRDKTMTLNRLLVSLGVLVVTVSAVPARDRYMWIPDSHGTLHLIDLLQPEIEDEPVPAFNAEKDVTLNLYTQKNPSTPQRISLSDDSAYPNFNPKHPTRFVMHGWTSSGKDFDHFRKAYIESGKDFNVVMVDWKSPASSEYSISKRNSRRVGEYLAEVIQHLAARKGLKLDDVSIIGHSLGGQAAGVAGHRLGGRIGKIVGLDAAAPLFGTTSWENKLDPSDAKHVQGIHTNGGFLGWKDPLGHVDFFPNGGGDQPGCGMDMTGSCSHSRAHAFYVESITSPNFVGAQCDSYKKYKKGTCADNHHDVLGEWTSEKAEGSYFLNTNKKSPYSQGLTD